MRRFAFLCLILGGILLVLLGGMVAVAFSPAFQRYVFLTLVPEKFDGKVQLDSIKLRPGSLNAEGLSLTREGWTLHAESIELEIALAETLFEKNLKINKATITGLELDLSRPLPPSSRTPPGESLSSLGPPVPGKEGVEFNGLFPYLETDYGIWLNGLRVEGRVLFSGNRSLSFEVKGGSIGPGKTGSVDFSAVVSGGPSGQRVTGGRISGKIDLTQVAGAGFSELQSALEIIPTGPGVTGNSALRLNLLLGKREEGEIMEMTLEQPAASRQVDRLADLKANFNPASKSFAGHYVLNIGSGNLAFLSVAFPLPEFLLQGEGKLAYSLNTRRGDLSGNLRINASQLEKVLPELGKIGKLELNARVDVAVEGGVASAQELNFNLKDNAGREFVKVDTLQPFAVELAGEAPFPTQTEGDLLSLQLVDFPIAWLSPWIEGSGYELTGDSISGRFLLIEKEGVLQLVSEAPLFAKDLSVGKGGERWLEAVDLDFKLDLSYAADRIGIDMENVHLESGKTSLLVGQGKARITLPEGAEPTLALSGDFSGTLEAWENQPILSEFGDFSHPRGLTLRTAFEMSAKGNALEMNSLEFRATDRKDQSLLFLKTLQSFTFDEMEDLNASSPALSGDIARADFENFPLEVLSPFLPGYSIRGDNLSGSFTVSGENNAYRLTSNEPFTVSGLSLAMEDRDLLKDASLTITPQFVFAPNLVEMSWKGLDFQSKGKTALAGDGSFRLHPESEQPIANLKLSLKSDLGELFQQPFLDAFGNVKTGRLSIVADVDLEDRKTVFIESGIRDLQATSDAAAKVAKVDWTIKGRMEKGNIIAQIPFTAAGVGGETDLLIEATLKPGKDNTLFVLSAEGEQLSVDDLLTVAEAFSLRDGAGGTKAQGSTRDQGLTAAAPLKRDEKPFWTGYTGKILLDIGKVRHTALGAFDKVRSTIRILPSQLSVDHFQGQLNGDPFSLKGKVKFNQSDLKPYHLEGDFTLRNFDVGGYFRQVDPRRRPPLEGIFSLAGKTKSEAGNPVRLMQNIRGDFVLENNRGGVFRALALGGEKAESGVIVAGVAGALLGGRSQGISTLNKLTLFLREIDYDTFTIHAVRKENLDIELSELFFKGPELILMGKGKIAYREDLPIAEQPMVLNAQIAAKDDAAYLLNDLGHLYNEQNSEGYYRGPSFSIKGNLSDPDTSDLTRILRGSVIGFLSGSHRVDLEGDKPAVDNKEENNAEGNRLQDTPGVEPSREEQILNTIIDIFGGGG